MPVKKSKIKKSKIIIPAIIGNIVEYYDFGLYAVYAPLFAKIFFPDTGNDFLQILLAFGIFAVGFMMRPLGGIFFGYIGDKLGRKYSLSISIMGMAASTLSIGLLPSYESIGMLAPILLTLIRLFQGLCVGGEGAGVAIFVLEHLEGYRPGLIGSIVMASNMVGSLIAVIVGIMINHFSHNEESWRYAFWFGGLVGFVGWYMRYQVNETPVFEAYKKSRQVVKHPIIVAFKTQFKNMLTVFIVGGATTAVAYSIRGYMNSYFQEILNFSQEDSLYFTSMALIIMIVFLPLYGVLADKIGYRRFFYYINFLVLISITQTFKMLSSGEMPLILLGIFMLGNLAAAMSAPAYPYVIKAFEVELRFTGVAFSWNMGNALMGGTMPFIGTYLTKLKGPLAASYYLMFVASLFIIISFLIKPKQINK